jgi:hypothetical protein
MKACACAMRPWVGRWRATVVPFRHEHCRLRALHAGSSFKYRLFVPPSVPSSVASPNWAVNGTHNGGPQLLASVTPAAPLRAPYLQR